MYLFCIRFPEQLSVEIVVEDAAAVGHLVFNNGLHPVHVALRNFRVRTDRCEAGGGGVGAKLGFPVIGQVENQRLPVGEHIPAHKQAGIKVHAEEIAQGGQDVQTGGGGGNLYRLLLFQTSGPDDQPVVVPFQPGCYVEAVKLGQIVQGSQGRRIVQPIGEVVGGDHDHRVVRLARRFQRFHGVFQCVFQFQLAGQICLDLFGVGEIFYLILVLDGAGILPVVDAVSADGHEVQVKGFVLIQIFGKNALHHFQITLGELVDNIFLHAAAHGHEAVGIAQQVVGAVSVVESAVVVVEGAAGVTEGGQEGGNVHHVVGGGKAHGVSTLGRQYTEQIQNLAAGGSGAGGLIVVGELESGVCQTVEGGRSFRVDDLGGEGFGTNENQILSGKFSGVSIFGGRSLAGYVCRQILGGAGAPVKRQIQLVLSVDHGLCFLGHAFGRLRGFRHRYRLCGKVLKLQGIVLAADVPQIQPNAGHQSEILHGSLKIVSLSAVNGPGQVGQMYAAPAQSVKHQYGGKLRKQGTKLRTHPGISAETENAVQHGGQQQKNQEQNAGGGGDQPEGIAHEAVDYTAGTVLDGGNVIQHLEHPEYKVFHTVGNGEHHQQDLPHNLIDPSGKQTDKQLNQCAKTQREEGNGNESRQIRTPKDADGKQNFPINQRQREKHVPKTKPAPPRGSGTRLTGIRLGIHTKTSDRQ